MDVLRKAIQQFPVELDHFEHRSSSIVSEMLRSKNKSAGASFSTQKLPHNATDPGPKSLCVDAIIPPVLEDRKRTLSLTSLNDKLKATSSPKSLKLRRSMTALTAMSITSGNREKDDAIDQLLDSGVSSDLQHSAPANSGGTNAPEATKVKEKSPSSTRRIAMADYLIKPVQRICKYPLLLAQLLPSKASWKGAPNAGKDVGGIVDIVESAVRAMRGVAASVNAARERQSIAIQSSLIFSRICLGLQLQGMLSSGSFSYPYSSHSGSPPHLNSSSRSSASTLTQTSQIRFLTPMFLSSLGSCLLSGSLDVIHYSHLVNTWSTSIKAKVKIKAKYLGVFLYDGGYMIFVKVGKGKRYEPRHWFALDGWDIISIDEEEGESLPSPLLSLSSKLCM